MRFRSRFAVEAGWRRPHPLLNVKRAGSARDAHEIVKEYEEKHSAECGVDDFVVGKMPEQES
jgi:hypothetical protein